MQRRVFVALLLTSALASAAPAEPSADAIAARVEAVYARAESYRAHFDLRVGGFLSKVTGTVTYQTPGRMSWRYAESGDRVVSDGSSVEIYEKANHREYRRPLSETQFGVTLAFLSGPLRERFGLRLLDSRRLHYPQGFVLEGVPLRPSPVCERALFYVDAATYHVRRVQLIDAQGNRVRYDYSRVELDVKRPGG